ncbi:MAG: hypothetical protein M3081_02440, partial [Gemmatimonadota bacterium]|nr:hypothetical protein [Gemmatimonadota bacterium]
VGVVLRFKKDTTLYLVFNRRLADSVLDGARLHFRGGVALSDVRFTADTGRVSWKVRSRSTYTAPGLRIHVRATFSAPPTGSARGDSLDLVLPGLLAVAEAHGKTPLVARGSYTRALKGDSDRVGEFAIYQSLDDARRASKRWEQVTMLLIGLLFVLGARVVLRLTADN